MRSRPLVFLACLVSLLVPTAPPARGLQAGGTWEVVPSPNTGSPHNALYGVDVIATDDVWAVGVSGVFDVEGARQVIQHWDGAAWSLAATPGSDAHSELRAVSAVDARDVWAVGGSGGQALIEHWNGSTWSVVNHPTPGLFNQFLGVSANSSDDVWAVGQFDDGGLSKTLVEHWNGLSWTVIPSPNVPNQHNKLTAVSAVTGSGDEVWAVGEAGASAPLIMHWDGMQWSIVPTPSAGFVPHLTGVVAITSDDVWATGWTDGTSGTITLTMHWNGSAWSVVPSPNPGSTFNYLWGVGAAASNDVWAVGDSNEGGDGRILILRWNGTSWLQVEGDNTGPSGLAFSLNAVSAISGGSAWAVGTNSHALTEHWDGQQWTIVPAPNVGVGNNILNAVSGSTANDVWQVGYTVFGTEHLTLIQHWDGESWRIVPSPNTGKRLNELLGVVALSASDAWAVGNATSGDVLDETTLILHWDGESWSFVPSPNPGSAFNSLRAISANAPDDIWAVGGFGPPLGPFKVLTEHWDGQTWTVVPGVNLPSTNNEFFGVTALASNDVWAVGYHGAFEFATLIEHWDGSAWSVVPSPASFSSNVLRAVAASGANDIWAVGTTKNFLTGTSGTITEHWNGSAWSLAFGVGGSFSSTLYGVAAASPEDAWEVGDADGGALIGYWDGRTWSVAPSPVVEGRLLAATALSACDVWAVGQRSGAQLGYVETLSMHFTQEGCDTVWTDLGHALAGAAGLPVLTGSGPLTPGSAAAVTLTKAASSAPSLLFVATSSTPVPFKGGTLLASPVATTLLLTTSPGGSLTVGVSSWPAGLSGLELFFQFAIQDAAAVKGVALSNGLKADIP